ncbi:MAG: hypothetical protein QOK37_2960 [Thermoanaerobaculia bacterium]|jgi:hypothetical protein|nr:hypothetical protein [Thermoanaerobaculia bacterium]
MNINRTIQAGILTLCLAGTPVAIAAPQTHRNTEVVDVNAHVLPPGPPHAKHVNVVNSAQHARRHHGVAGMFQRLHQWHMRQRAHIYRAVNSR